MALETKKFIKTEVQHILITIKFCITSCVNKRGEEFIFEWQCRKK